MWVVGVKFYYEELLGKLVNTLPPDALLVKDLGLAEELSVSIGFI